MTHSCYNSEHKTDIEVKFANVIAFYVFVRRLEFSYTNKNYASENYNHSQSFNLRNNFFEPYAGHYRTKERGCIRYNETHA